MAAPPFFLFGSSPDQLANQQFQYSQFFRRADESDRAARARADEITMDAFLNRQQADEKLQELDLDRAQRARELTAREAESGRNFFATEDYRAADLAERRRAAEADIAFKRDALKESTEKQKATLIQFSADKDLAGLEKARSFFATPQPASNVDLSLIEATTGVPQPILKPMAEHADRQFAIQQAAQMNAAFLDMQAKAAEEARKDKGNIFTGLSPEQIGGIRKQVERLVGEQHPLVKWNDAEQGWEFTGGKKAAKAEPVTPEFFARQGRTTVPATTSTGTNPAFFNQPEIVPPAGSMGGGFFPQTASPRAQVPSPRNPPLPEGRVIIQNGIRYRIVNGVPIVL